MKTISFRTKNFCLLSTANDASNFGNTLYKLAEIINTKWKQTLPAEFDALLFMYIDITSESHRPRTIQTL